MNSAWPFAAEGSAVAAPGIDRHKSARPLIDTQRMAGLLSRLCDHIEERRLAALDHGDGARERGTESLRLLDRTLGPHAHRLRELGVVDVRIGDGGADMSAVDAAVAPVG